MFPQARQLELWELTKEPCDIGTKRVKSKRSVLQEVKDVTTSPPKQLNLFDTPSSTLGFRVLNNEKTCSVNVMISNLNTLQQKLSQKLAEVLTTNGKNFSPYWSELCQEISSVLLSRINTDSPDLVSISGRGDRTDIQSRSQDSPSQSQE